MTVRGGLAVAALLVMLAPVSAFAAEVKSKQFGTSDIAVLAYTATYQIFYFTEQQPLANILPPI
jgi:hypothetical protein